MITHVQCKYWLTILFLGGFSICWQVFNIFLHVLCKSMNLRDTSIYIRLNPFWLPPCETIWTPGRCANPWKLWLSDRSLDGRVLLLQTQWRAIHTTCCMGSWFPRSARTAPVEWHQRFSEAATICYTVDPLYCGSNCTMLSDNFNVSNNPIVSNSKQPLMLPHVNCCFTMFPRCLWISFSQSQTSQMVSCNLKSWSPPSSKT
jgi:hypothetical protein